jgi:hypothetical protein
MKKAIIFLNGLLVAALILACFDAQAQGIKLGGTRTGLNPGDTLRVPLYLTGTGIFNGSVYFNYDQSVLAPQASLFKQFFFPTYGLSGIPNPDYATGIYSYDFQSNDIQHSLPPMTDQLIGYFCFIYIGGTSGTTTIHLRRSPDPNPVCGFWNLTGARITILNYSADFSISGSTGISAITLSSLSTGGPFDWDDPNAWIASSGSPNTGILSPATCFNVFVTGDEVDINGTTPGPARCNNLTINSGGKLTVDPNLYGSIVLSPAGTFTIQSGGSFIDNDGNTLTATVNRYVTGDWVPGSTTYHAHLITSPVSLQSNIIFWGSIMNQWSETSQTWVPLTVPYITMGVGVGYDLSPANPGITAAFSGALNTGDKSVSGLTLSGNPSTGWYGYNLVGNPFPSAMNFTPTYQTAYNFTNVEAKAWVWNGAGAYLPYEMSLGGGVIGSEQGFFVHVTSGTGSLTLPNAARTHNSSFYKSTISDLLTLRVDGNNYWDQSQVYVNSQATTGYDAEYDARKLMGSADAPQLYSITPDYDLSINTLPSLDANNVIPFGFLPGASGTFVITASGMETFPSGQDFYLEDILTSQVQELNTNPVYTFTAAPGQQEHRFNLHFTPLGINEATGSNIRIYSSEQTIYVNIPFALRGDIIVYNVMGVELARKAIIGNSLNVLNTGLNTGYYIVKVLGDTQSTSSKVFIR